MEKKYFVVSSIRLAKALSFLGFEYYTFKNEDSTAFSFVDSRELREARKKLLDLRDKYHVDYK